MIEDRLVSGAYKEPYETQNRLPTEAHWGEPASSRPHLSKSDSRSFPSWQSAIARPGDSGDNKPVAVRQSRNNEKAAGPEDPTQRLSLPKATEVVDRFPNRLT